MTSNQINYQRNEIEARNAETNKQNARTNARNADTRERELEETRRNNKQVSEDKNRATYFKAGTDVFGSVMKANDPSWYNLDRTLVDNVAKLPFAVPLGSQISKMYHGTTVPREPGLMSLTFSPTLPVTVDNQVGTESSAINIAAKKLYGYVREANSGAANYDPVDLMMYYYAMSSLYMVISWAQRLYSMLLEAKAEDRYYPSAYISAAIGTRNQQEVTTWYRNIANFKAYINMAVVRVSAFAVPDIMPLYKRLVWLTGNIFKDAPVKRSQQYIFVPSTYYMYDDKHGKLLAKKFDVTTYDKFIKLMDELIESLVTSQDIGNFSGDVKKAYSESSLVHLNQISSDYHVESIYSEEVLSQIGGSVLVGEPVYTAEEKTNSWTIRQTPTGIIYQGMDPTVDEGKLSYSPLTLLRVDNTAQITTTGRIVTSPASGPNYRYSYVNLYKDDASPDDVMVATRLTAQIDLFHSPAYNPAPLAGDEKYWTWRLGACGTEVLHTAKIWYYDTNGILQDIVVSSSYLNCPNEGPDMRVSSTKYFIQRMLAKFDWAPFISFSVVGVDTSGTGATQVTTIDLYYAWDNVEIQNFHYISRENLWPLHAVASLSEFGVPLIGTSSGKYRGR